MKTKTMALALLLLAGASQAAVAQEHRTERQGQVRERRFERREARPGSGEAPAAPQAREAPRAQEPHNGGWRRGGGGDRRQNWPAQARPGWTDEGGGGFRSGADGRDDEDWDELRQARRWGGKDGERWVERDRQVREDGQRRDERQDRDRGDRARDRQNRDQQNRDDRSGWRRDNGRRGDVRRDDNRSGYYRRDGRDAPRWESGRYPRVYSSPHRYRVPAYRRPPGFYVRSWAFGEVLPRGWYGPEYRLFDWWAYGLPMPPPGYSWVRVGADVLLVDDFSGRIVQVVRYVFW